MNIPKIKNSCFVSNIYFNRNYKKEDTITILGSSKTTPSIERYLEMCSEVAKSAVIADKNILTGCGDKGIMGSAYYTAAKYSTRNDENKPEQNIVILKDPLWGDEDLENCVIVGVQPSEAHRIQNFIETSNSFVFFPGGAGTLQEATTIISNNNYAKDSKKVILVGKDFFKPLDEQYQNMYSAGLLNKRPDELYAIVDSSKEAKEILGI